MINLSHQIKHWVYRLRALSSPARLGILVGIVVVLPIIVALGTYSYYARDITTKDGIMNRHNTGVTLLDRTGKPFYRLYEAKSITYTPIANIPTPLQQGLVATEDQDFYKHGGFSLRSIVRAIFADILNQSYKYGGSTITQQLVKNTLLSRKKSLLRKYQEIVLASEIERRFTKSEILEMYFNSVYFGEGEFGVEGAARAYFGKSAKDLDVAESALLVGILPAPSLYDPLHSDGKAAIARQRLVLKNLAAQHYISPAQQKLAEAEPLIYATQNSSVSQRAPHFAQMVRDELIRRYGEEQITRSGFKVKTTLDLGWQASAERQVARQLGALSANHVSNAGVVATDPRTGEVKALVGSADFENPAFGQVNMAITPRQPGSSFKPIVYAAGIESRSITAATLLPDVPTDFGGGYQPLDYDKRFRGEVLARRALANSLNIPSVAVMQKTGLDASLAMARKMGITTLNTPEKYGLSLVLGTGEVKLLELTSAYGTFANSGQYVAPATILSITDKRNKNLFDYIPQPQKKVDPGVAYIISSMLSDSRARAEIFKNTLNTTKLAAVKTGTTEDYKDAWTMGYSRSVAIGVWLGNNDNTPMDQVAGSLGAAPIWRALMEQFSDPSAGDFTQPADVTGQTICASSGLLAKRGGSGTYEEYFLTGTVPTRQCQAAESKTVPAGAGKQKGGGGKHGGKG